MQIGILGPLEVHGADGAPLPVAGARLRRLLTRLALDAGRAVPTGELVDAVWMDDPPHDVVNALQSLVSRLRRALGDPTLIHQVAAGYRLELPRESVDAEVFADMAATGRRQLKAGDAAAAADTLRRALQVWRGIPLADADDAPYAAAPVARWDELRLAAAADRIDAELALGNPGPQIAELDELVAAHPLHERFVGQLMSALAATGRTADALAAYQNLRTRLADTLGADPGAEIAAQHLALLRGEQAGGTAAPGRRTNLRAAVSSFIGREAELERIGTLVTAQRLTTIVGPGGAGKTRLATRAATPFADRRRDGVWLVELAPVTEPSAISQAVLAALGMREAKLLERRVDMRGSVSATDRLLDVLGESDALLVIDNCEHLIGAVAEFVELLLARCPAVRVLATSREPLGLPGEVVVAIPPLGLPPAGATADEAMSYPSVRLLAERGRAASSGFAVSEDTVTAVVDIVRRLDGLPLAIELAAARLRVLPVTEIAARLSDRFRLLAGGLRTSVARHRTLRAVVEWSWDLLSASERLLAERLAVFPAGMTTTAAQQVCADDGFPDAEIADLLMSLADKSLLQVQPMQAASRGAAMRYRMLETIREYGVERLEEHGELAQARLRHARYYAGLAHRLSPVLRTARQLDALGEFAAEHDNMLAALRYLGDSADPDAALGLVLDLSWYWNITGDNGQMAEWSQFALDCTDRDGVDHDGIDRDGVDHDGIERDGVDHGGIDHSTPARIRVEASRLLSRFTMPTMDPQQSWEALQEQAERIAPRLAEIDDGTDPMTTLARMYIGFLGHGGSMTDELAEMGRSSPDPWMRAMTLAMHVMYLENRGEIDAMRTEIDQAHAAFAGLGDRWGLSTMLAARAGLRSMDGDVDGAIADFEQAKQYLDQLGSSEDDMVVDLRMAGLRMRQGDLAAARRHVDAVRAGHPGKPVSVERALLGDAVLLSLLLAEGAVEQARALSADLRRRVPSGVRVNPMQGHMIALVGAVCGVAAVSFSDLLTAETDLCGAYPAALATHDAPLIASVGVSTAELAGALGRAHDGAEILGAAAALRGADDLGDVWIGAVRERLVAALGRGPFDEAYAAGRSLDKDTAAKRIDPGLLLDGDQEEAPVRSGARGRGSAADHQGAQQFS